MYQLFSGLVPQRLRDPAEGSAPPNAPRWAASPVWGYPDIALRNAAGNGAIIKPEPVGVTIHFEGRLKDGQCLAAALALARKFSDEHQWPCRPIDEAHVTLKRVREEVEYQYSGPVQGLEIEPHKDSEPFRLEFDRDIYVQEYCKTQFAPIEVHVQLVELLSMLKPLFQTLEVFDEGEYFETGDLTLLAQHRSSCLEVIEQYLAEPDKHHGPIRLESGRIVDIISRD